jgi:hypothetical protein
MHIEWLCVLPNEGASLNEDGSHNCEDRQTAHTRCAANFQRHCFGIFVDDDVLAQFEADVKDLDINDIATSLEVKCARMRAKFIVFRAVDVHKVWEMQRLARKLSSQLRPPKVEEAEDSEDLDKDEDDRDVEKVPEEWMYVSTGSFVHFYSELAGDERWDRMYRKPPRVWQYS